MEYDSVFVKTKNFMNKYSTEKTPPSNQSTPSHYGTLQGPENPRFLSAFEKEAGPQIATLPRNTGKPLQWIGSCWGGYNYGTIEIHI